jgi:hypothetical protein
MYVKLNVKRGGVDVKVCARGKGFECHEYMPL